MLLVINDLTKDKYLFTDVVSIPKTNENFRLLYDTKGRFRLHSIKDEEAKVCSPKSLTLPYTESVKTKSSLYSLLYTYIRGLLNLHVDYQFVIYSNKYPLLLLCSSSFAK